MYGYDLTKGDEKDEQELKPCDLWVTYMAADKYLVEGLKDELMLGSVYRLNKFNVCLLFDQFLKIPLDEVGSFLRKDKGALLNEFKKFIQVYSKDAFESESFLEIDEETLVELLKLEFLNMPETDVLRACLRWTDAEMKRQGLVATNENKRKVFSQVKPFVRFIDLNYDQLTELAELKDVLSIEELGSVFLKLTGGCDHISIDCKTERKKGRKVYEAIFDDGFSSIDEDYYVYKLSVNLKVNQKVCITSIQTYLKSSVSNLELKGFKQGQEEFVPLPFVEFKRHLVHGKWCFEPGRTLEIDPHVNYQLVFSFAAIELQFEYFSNSSSFSTRVGENKYHFSLRDFGKYHCIKSLHFCQISNYEKTKSV